MMEVKMCIQAVSEGLRLVRLDMPGVVIRGDPVWLNCSFDLELDDLYSVKWYKNNREFFRYLPNEEPPGQAYKLSGVYVDVPADYERMYPVFSDQVLLYHSSLGLTFTAEPHHFTYGIMKLKCTATVSGAYSLSSEEIVAAQDAKNTGADDDKPTITGGQTSYHVGDLVNVTCTYARHKRRVDLQWHLNDKEVSNRYLVHYPPQRLESGRQVASLGLRFTVRPSHFVNDEMRIKCTATLQNATRGPPATSSSAALDGDSRKGFMLGSSHRSSGLHVSEQYGTGTPVLIDSHARTADASTGIT
ncbi:hypothetical protein V5799_030056 [Amblyomma americanum]|uniref:Ig-like domain-containing protein n=1 Tax=Amblyomma americanum TaxID=6943 RepID=A0AAQ4EP99_AMBAM